MRKDGLLDPYVIRARGFPLFMLALPIACGAWPWLAAWSVMPWSKLAVGGLLGSLFLAFLIRFGGQISRDMGRAAEERLMVGWGAHRTGRMLRWRDSAFQAQKATMLANLSALTGIPAPSQVDEERNPEAVDRIYAGYADRLRAHALTHKAEPRFAMVNEERAEYGQARNFYGMRRVMWLLLSVGAVSLGAASWHGHQVVVPSLVLVGTALMTGYLARASLVKRRSDDFAVRLLETALEPLVVRAEKSGRNSARSKAKAA
jgi:hypothetical protein